MNEWKSEMIENGERIEKLEDIKDLVFSHILFGWKDEKVERWKTIKNEIGINLQLCPY